MPPEWASSDKFNRFKLQSRCRVFVCFSRLLSRTAALAFSLDMRPEPGQCLLQSVDRFACGALGFCALGAIYAWVVSAARVGRRRGGCCVANLRSFDGLLNDAQGYNGAISEVGINPLDDLRCLVLHVECNRRINLERQSRAWPPFPAFLRIGEFVYGSGPFEFKRPCIACQSPADDLRPVNNQVGSSKPVLLKCLARDLGHQCRNCAGGGMPWAEWRQRAGRGSVTTGRARVLASMAGACPACSN